MATKVTYTGDGNIAFCEKVGLCPKSMTRKVRLKYSQLVRAVHVLPFLCKTCCGIASAWPKTRTTNYLKKRLKYWPNTQNANKHTMCLCVYAKIHSHTHTHTHMHTTGDCTPLYGRLHTHNAIMCFTHKHEQKHTSTHTHTHTQTLQATFTRCLHTHYKQT